MTNSKRIRIERTYLTTLEKMWDAWTTRAGVESWWGPEGFRVDVLELELQPGGKLHYAMTATAPEQVAFLNGHGLPLTNETHATYRTIERPRAFAYDSKVDFVPGIEPYTISNEVELVANGAEVKVILTFDPMHDAEWTERLVNGRKGQLEKLARVLA